MTGRLIEEKAVLDLAHDIIIGEYRHRCIDPSAVRELPTVDAIPVEWLKSHMITHSEVVNGDYFEDEALELNMYVSDLIERWKAEQRKEE